MSMITNIFSIFDPATSNNFSANWLSILIFLLFLPSIFWVVKNRNILIYQKLIMYIKNEFKNLINKTPEILIIIISLFFIIIILNIQGLLPFTFTNFSHISNTLIISLPLWLATFIYSWLNNTSNTLVHLIPNRTPVILIPFMVIIETIRRLIRPLTLAIRLAANIIAGHLLVSLLINATPLANLISLPILGSAQIILIRLEVAVAAIQAYVFTVLITLYAAERNN